MNKKLLATAMGAALVGSMAVAQADTTVYGNINLDMRNTDIKNGSNNTSMESNTSALGVKGSEDLGNGLAAIYKLEFQVAPDQGTTKNSGSAIDGRDQWLGLKGGFGQVVFGTVSTAYKSAGAMIDPMYRTPVEARGFLNQQSALHSGKGDNGEGRATNTIRYDSPNFMGATVVVNYSQNQKSNANTNNSWGGGLHYKNGPIIAAVDYETNGVSGDNSAWSFAGKYSMDNGLAVGGMYEIDDGLISQAEGVMNNGTTASLTSAANHIKGANVWYLFGSFTMGNTLLYASYGQRSTPDSATGSYTHKQKGWALAADYALSKRTDAYLGYGETTYDGTIAANAGTCGTASGECNVWSVGLRHKF